MLGSNGTRNTQTSSSGHLRSLEPHHDRSSSKSPLSGDSTDFDKASPTQPFTSDIEKGLSFPQKAKSRPLALTPVISAFSTYKKTGSDSRKSIREKGISLPIAAWKNSLPLDAANESSKSSLGSFDAAWLRDQPSGGDLKAQGHVRREGSKDVLEGRGSSSGKDGSVADEK